MSTTRVNGNPNSTSEVPGAASEPVAGVAGRSDQRFLEALAERNACNERALAELRAAHEVLRRRYEAAVERLGLGAAPEHPRRV